MTSSAPDQRLERGGQGRAIHRQQGRDWRHGRRRGAVQGVEQGELAIGQAARAQRVVESAREDPRRPLDMKAEARIADMLGRLESK